MQATVTDKKFARGQASRRPCPNAPHYAPQEPGETLQTGVNYRIPEVGTKSPQVASAGLRRAPGGRAPLRRSGLGLVSEDEGGRSGKFRKQAGGSIEDRAADLEPPENPG